MKKTVALSLFAFFLLAGFVKGQNFALDPVKYHVFDKDSLEGFEQAAAERGAISEGFTGAEFPVRMYQLKRGYINNKYNLVTAPPKIQQNIYARQSSVVTPACTNEDFEATSAGTITATNQVAGWTVTQGSVNSIGSPTYPNNSCNLGLCCPNSPSESAVFNAPNGLIDPIIGSCYPIYSVFGSGPGDPAGSAANPQIVGGLKGDNFIRINSSLNNNSVEKLSKTFSVTPNNVVFQFAFIAVFSVGHGCCDAGAFSIKLPGIACPTFSASAPSAQCTSTTMTWLNDGIHNNLPTSGHLPCSPLDNSSDYVFNKWQISSIDLTPYLGQTITIEIVATDCTAGGHFGYVYFDAQCSPMTIIGNGNPFPAGTPSVTLPTCGASGATICATPGLGPYSWAGPNVPLSYATPAYTNQCFTSSLSATYTLYMNPPGACAPITRVINTTITPAPQLVANVVQATCGNTLAIVSVTPGGSAGSPSYISWFPTPVSLNSSTTMGTYAIPPGPNPKIVSITASDPLGCLVTVTAGVNPAAPIPTFQIANLSNTYTISCYTPSITLDLSTTYTYGTLGYFWSSSSYTSNATNVTLTRGGTYTITATDPVTQCAIKKVVTIGTNTTAPTTVLSPTFQSITCNSTVQTVNASSTSPTVNITHVFMSPLGGGYTSTGPNASYEPGFPGTYTHVVTNNANGCKTVKEFTVFSNQGFPTFTLVSPQNFTLGCSTKSFAIINISQGNTNPQGGAVSYTLLSPTASSVLPPGGNLSGQSVYTVTTPGTWTVVVRDNVSLCNTRMPQTILSNTLAPSIDTVIVPFPVLSCATPTTKLKGVSFTNNVNYNWSLPNNLNQSGDTLTVAANFATRTSTMLANYTLTIEDNSSTCKSTTVIPIRQNLFAPKALITNGGTNSLTCITPSVVLTNFSSSQIPPNTFYGSGNPPLPVVGLLWEGPTPQLPQENTSTYLALQAGEYTMTAKDMNNGCTTTTILTLFENRVYPLLDPPVTTPSLDCGSKDVTIIPKISTDEQFLTFQWISPPEANTSDPSKRNLTTNMTGEYKFIASDKKNGCVSDVVLTVLSGTLTAGFAADREKGYAPMTVNFINNSTSSTGNSSITTVWVFGNGGSITSTAAAVPVSTVFTQPGTYVVTMFAKKGLCVQTSTRTIEVELPSQIIVPNVFTPNGDGANDLFILQRSSNISEVKIEIFDRWGHKVYDLVSEKGQIEWDGKNQFGKECPEGTYFYILKAIGRDDMSYEKKGTISLMR
jgi:gliding motility-associated-like protein